MYLKLKLRTVTLAWWMTLALASAVIAEPFGADPENLRIRRITTGEGLAQSSVFALEQDRQGFMWIGTQDGLHRYDGYAFTIFKPKPFESGALSSALIQVLLEDRQGALWVGTFLGLDRFDPVTRRFESAFPNETLRVVSLYEDSHGDLWAGTVGDGLRRRQPDGTVTSFQHHDAAPEGLAHGTVRAVLEDTSKTLWIGTDAGLQRFDPTHQTFETVGLEGYAVTQLLEVHGESGALDGLWIATDRGLHRRRPDGTFEAFRHRPEDPTSLADDRVTALLADGELLWVGTHGGLDAFDPRSGRFIHHRHAPSDLTSLSHDHVWSLDRDRSGLLWVGTAFGGVNVIDTRSKFRHVRPQDAPGHLRHGVVRDLLEDRTGALWIATDGGGLYLRRAGQDAIDPIDGRHGLQALRDGRLWHLHEDTEGYLWIGADSGLHRLDPERRRGRRFAHDPSTPDSLAPGSVRWSLEDRAGTLWTAHFGGGLSRLSGAIRGPGQPTIERFVHDPTLAHSLASDLALVLFEDSRDRVWVGTVDGLDLHLGDGRFRHFRHDPEDPKTLLGNMVRALHEDPPGTLWIGTDLGLNRFDLDSLDSPAAGPPKIEHFTEEDGLPNHTVYAIASDGEGRLWLSTNRGLASFDPDQREFTSYDPNDGVQGWEFNGGSVAQGSGGELYFGGLAGFNVFRPSDIKPNPHVPPVVFTGLRKLGQGMRPVEPLDGRRQIDLDWDDNVVTFEFAALDFTDPPMNRYAYRLEGFSEGWIDLGNRHEATFTNLPAGQYVLRIRGTNDDGVWNFEGDALEIVVHPAPWFTWWAWLLYTLGAFFVLGVVGWQRWRRHMLRREINRVVRDSERRLQLALVGSGDGLWDWDIGIGEIYRSHVDEMLGYGVEELPPNEAFRQELIHPEDQERVEGAIREHLEGRAPRYEAEYRMRHADGSWRWILDRGVIVERDAHGKPQRLTGTFKDLTKQKSSEDELRLWLFIFESIAEGVMVTDTSNVIQAVNSAFCRMTGYTSEEVIGHPTNILESPYHDPSFYQAIRDSLFDRGRWRGELQQQRKDGSSFWAEIDFNQVVDDAGQMTNFVAVFSDITKRKKAEEELLYLASYDTLTGLPNRAHFQKHLEQSLAGARQGKYSIALFFGDLDRFKSVNDSLGHAVGDQLLVETARRLRNAVRHGDLVARLGGDEFTVLLGRVDGKADVERVGDRILAAFEEPFHLEGHALSITTSLGISLFPQDARDAATLVKQADSAMYEAKAEGRNCYRFHTSETDSVVLQGKPRRANQPARRPGTDHETDPQG